MYINISKPVISIISLNLYYISILRPIYIMYVDGFTWLDKPVAFDNSIQNK